MPVPGSSTTNSSPPYRADTSLPRTSPLMQSRELPQHLVARQMPETVVDGFEVVDVDHEAGQRRPISAAASELLVQARLKIAPVVPSRQHVREAAAHEPRAVDGALERERGDDGQVVQKIRAEEGQEAFALAAAEVQAADQPFLPRQRQQAPRFRAPPGRGNSSVWSARLNLPSHGRRPAATAGATPCTESTKTHVALLARWAGLAATTSGGSRDRDRL